MLQLSPLRAPTVLLHRSSDHMFDVGYYPSFPVSDISHTHTLIILSQAPAFLCLKLSHASSVPLMSIYDFSIRDVSFIIKSASK